MFASAFAYDFLWASDHCDFNEQRATWRGRVNAWCVNAVCNEQYCFDGDPALPNKLYAALAKADGAVLKKLLAVGGTALDWEDQVGSHSRFNENSVDVLFVAIRIAPRYNHQTASRTPWLSDLFFVLSFLVL